MIYVVELLDGTPKQLRKSAQVAAYTSRESAERAARSLGGVVREYGVGGGNSAVTEELNRVIEELRLALRQERDRHVSTRIRLGDFARRNGGHYESDFEDVAQRIEREARAWRKVAKVVKQISGEEIVKP
jgi:hypothetical protein